MNSSPHKTKEKTLPVLIKEADAVFSKWIRRRDTKDGRIKCFTCGVSMTFQEAQCGHYIDRDQMPTRYDEMNCKSVCEYCNCFDDHHKERFDAALRKIMSPEGMNHLWHKSRGLQKFMRFELQEIIEKHKI